MGIIIIIIIFKFVFQELNIPMMNNQMNVWVETITSDD